MVKVNQVDPKTHIISILHSADEVISGEVLSDRLGVSRVSVWKHIKGLVQQGVPIVATSKGYRLEDDPDSLQPWNFKRFKDRIHFFQETSSTMDVAMDLVRQGCPDFSVVVAQRQLAGRGRMQRTWISGDGGLYFSVVTRPDIPMLQVGLVNLAAAVDMADLLRREYGIEACLKWPNDILVDQRKICGVLSQMEGEGDRVAWMNIGIGLNVNNAPEREEPLAVSLKALLGRRVPRRPLLEAFLERFERRIGTFDPLAVIEQWRSNNATLGRPVRVVTVKTVVEGTAVDIDAHGGLMVALADGSRQTLIHGDCFHT
jgi:BirA family transcriptional regulator, biotin operon repressor / biotin---[acetyl-CoA-carboxylase] ligase